MALGAVVANATSGASAPGAIIISVGNTLEAVVGSMLLRERAGRAHTSLAEAQELAHIGSCEWDISSNRIT